MLNPQNPVLLQVRDLLLTSVYNKITIQQSTIISLVLFIIIVTACYSSYSYFDFQSSISFLFCKAFNCIPNGESIVTNYYISTRDFIIK